MTPATLTAIMYRNPEAMTEAAWDFATRAMDALAKREVRAAEKAGNITASMRAAFDNAALINEANAPKSDCARLVIIHAILAGSTSTVEIAESLGRNRTNITARVREMVKCGILLSAGPRDSSKARVLSVSDLGLAWMDDPAGVVLPRVREASEARAEIRHAKVARSIAEGATSGRAVRRELGMNSSDTADAITALIAARHVSYEGSALAITDAGRAWMEARQ